MQTGRYSMTGTPRRLSVALLLLLAAALPTASAQAATPRLTQQEAFFHALTAVHFDEDKSLRLVQRFAPNATRATVLPEPANMIRLSRRMVMVRAIFTIWSGDTLQPAHGWLLIHERRAERKTVQVVF